MANRANLVVVVAKRLAWLPLLASWLAACSSNLAGESSNGGGGESGAAGGMTGGSGGRSCLGAGGACVAPSQWQCPAGVQGPPDMCGCTCVPPSGDSGGSGGSGGFGGLSGGSHCPENYAAALSSAGGAGPVCDQYNDLVDFGSCGSYETWTAYSIFGSITCDYASDGTLVFYSSCLEGTCTSGGDMPDGGSCVDAGFTTVTCHSAGGTGGFGGGGAGAAG